MTQFLTSEGDIILMGGDIMKFNKLKVVLLLLAVLTMLASISNADEIDDALREAYQNGYEDGYSAGRNSGGGGGGGGGGSGSVSVGHVVGFSVSSDSGGSTSGSEVPWAYRLDNSKAIMQFMKDNQSANPEIKMQKNEAVKVILEQFKADKKETGTIVIEDMQMGEFDKLESFLKESDSGNVWVAPSTK